MSLPSRLSLTLVIIIVLCFGSGSLHAEGGLRVVRVLNEELARSLRNLHHLSPAARRLVDHLERSDLLIHVVGMGLDRPRQFIGTTRFMIKAGARRFLRIAVDESPARSAVRKALAISAER